MILGPYLYGPLFSSVDLQPQINKGSIMTNAIRVNKSAAVRQILNDIGALSNNPPVGWRKRVEEALKKQGLEVHQVSIYQARSKLMKSMGISADSEESAAVPTKKPAKPKTDNFTVSDMTSVRDFAAKFGGLDGLLTIISTIKSFSS